MSDELDDPSNWVTGNIGFQSGGQPREMKVTIPKIPIHPQRMLPVLQQMSNAFVDLAVRQVEAEGKTVQCKAGCGACCRQLVPISRLEARQLSQLVDSMPEPRRTEIRRRFDDAVEKLNEAKLLELLQNPEQFSDEANASVGIDYFRLKIPCPFLEQESCSIHLDRPIACREYLVTSPSEECARPTPESVRQVPVLVQLSRATIRLSPQGTSRFIPYVPLVLAIDWANAHEDEFQESPGPHILSQVMKNLAD